MSSGRLRRAKAAIFIGFTLLILGFTLSYYSLALMAPSQRAGGVLGPAGSLRLGLPGSHERVYYMVNSTGREGNLTITFYDSNGTSVGFKTIEMGSTEKGSVVLEGKPRYAIANCTNCQGVRVELYYSRFDSLYTAVLSILGAIAAMVGLAFTAIGVHVYMDERGLYLEDRRKKPRRSSS